MVSAVVIHCIIKLVTCIIAISFNQESSHAYNCEHLFNSGTLFKLPNNDPLDQLENILQQKEVTKLYKSRGNEGRMSILERKLKIKERECELLSAMQEKDVYNQVLQKKIDKKKKKITILKNELQWKERELQSVLQQLQTQQWELSDAQKVLKKQHEEAVKLVKEKEELAYSSVLEKQQLRKIIQILTLNKEEMQVSW